MEKLLKPYDKQYMKMAMLKHEETFKQQVYELHRLYQIQKKLMKGIKNNRPSRQNQEIGDYRSGISLTPANDNHHLIHQKLRPGLDLEQPAEDYVIESNGNGELEIEDESEIQLTLGLMSYNQRKKQETPRTSDSGPSFNSSTSTGSSSQHKKRTTREELTDHINFLSDSNLGFQMEEEQLMRQDRLKQPPWLFQALTMNMT